MCESNERPLGFCGGKRVELIVARRTNHARKDSTNDKCKMHVTKRTLKDLANCRCPLVFISAKLLIKGLCTRSEGGGGVNLVTRTLSKT